MEKVSGKYYHVCEFGESDGQKSQADHIYDSITHNELTCGEAITKILELCSEEYDESPELVLDGESIIGKSADGKHILMYDAFSGIFDVFVKQ